MNRFSNALGFQLGWWSCIFAVKHDYEIVALIFSGLLVGLHLWLSKNRTSEIQVAISTWLIGTLVDSSLQYFSIIHFYGWTLYELSPFWLWMLWVLFALTLDSSLYILKKISLVWSALVGSLFGPLSYIGGSELGAAKFDYSTIHLTILSGTWLILMPCLVFLAQKISPPNDKGNP